MAEENTTNPGMEEMLNKLQQQADGKPDEEPEEENQQTDPEPKKEEPKPEGTEGNKGTETKTIEDDKATKAFAAQRVRIKELESQVRDLMAKLEKSGTSDPAQDPKPEEAPDVTKRIAQLEQETKLLREEREKERRDYTMQVKASQLQSLKTEYGLKDEDLYKFANDAEQRGIDLMETKEDLGSLYKTIYVNEIIDREVKRMMKELGAGGNSLPTPGPEGSGGNKKENPDPRALIDMLDKKTKN